MAASAPPPLCATFSRNCASSVSTRVHNAVHQGCGVSFVKLSNAPYDRMLDSYTNVRTIKDVIEFILLQ
jgi:hypothetical protein